MDAGIDTLGRLEDVTCDDRRILSRTGRSQGGIDAMEHPAHVKSVSARTPIKFPSHVGVSQHDLPTGDVEGDTSNPRRGRRGEEERGGSDVLGLAYSPEGKSSAQGLSLGFWRP